MSIEKVHGGVGVVVIPCQDETGRDTELRLTIAPLSIAAERVLIAEMKAIVSSERRKLCRESLASIGAVERPTWADELAVRELVAMSVGVVTFADTMAKRYDYDGIALELYHRSRAANPKITLQQIQSAVTIANAGDDIPADFVAQNRTIDLATETDNEYVSALGSAQADALAAYQQGLDAAGQQQGAPADGGGQDRASGGPLPAAA